MIEEITPSNRIGIVAANHTGYVEAMFQCIEAGNIAVPLRSTDDFYRIKAANVDKVVVPAPFEDWFKRQFNPSKADAVALITFTSGTEGSPKGVILTHNNLSEVVIRLNSLMQLDDSINEYIGVPVYHSFGFGRCRAVATAGGRFFIPSNGFNPSEIGTMLKNREINAISAVPSLWRVLLANSDLIGSYGKRVRWIEIGSQYMSRQEKEALKTLFPEARIVQHYGLTEASRTALLEIHKAEGDALESVGQASGSVGIKLSEDGRIAIRGDHVAQGYLIDGKAVQLQDKDGWFLTKDLGCLENDYLYYKGRADDVINCGGIKIHPEALETKIYANFGYTNGLAICRKIDPMRGEGFLVAVTNEMQFDKQQLREAILQATHELGVNAASAITIIDVDSLPKTASGKIQRKQLEEAYALKLSHGNHARGDINTSLDVRSPIQSIFCRTLNIRQVQPQDTFVSLGGDSLSYVQQSMELERHLGYLPKRWEQMSLRELDKLIPQKRLNTIIEIDILLRTLAISGVVFNHSGIHLLEGGAFLLLLMAGLNFSRFQGCALIQGRLWSVIPLLRNIVIPYFILSISYQVFKQNFDPLILLVLGNFQVPELQISNSIFFVWFIANLVQTIILFSLPFNIQAVRNFASLSPWRFGLVTLGIGIGTRLIGPYVWDTSYLYDQVPHMLMWLFALGWCIHFSKTKVEKSITTAIALVIVPSFIGFSNSQAWWVLTGGIMLTWLQYVTIPKVIKAPIQIISASSFYIYLTVLISVHFVTKTIGITYPLAIIFTALIVGVLAWSIVQSSQRFLSIKHFEDSSYNEQIL